MNSVRRAVAVIASRNRAIWHSNTRIEQSYLSTMAAENSDYPKPTEIPYEASNSVNLTGCIDKPVRILTAHNGEVWAATTISQIPFLDSPHIWVPVIFEGDLAHIAACHLKQNDHVNLAGQLIADSPTDKSTQGNANFLVLVRSIKFMEPFYQTIKQEEVAVNDSGDESWKDLVENPDKCKTLTSGGIRD